jgi:hypothetical protein
LIADPHIGAAGLHAGADADGACRGAHRRVGCGIGADEDVAGFVVMMVKLRIENRILISLTSDEMRAQPHIGCRNTGLGLERAHAFIGRNDRHRRDLAIRPMIREGPLSTPCCHSNRDHGPLSTPSQRLKSTLNRTLGPPPQEPHFMPQSHQVHRTRLVFRAA